MRRVVLLTALALTPFAQSRAFTLACGDSAKPDADKTLFQKLHFRAAHFDVGGGSGRIDGESAGNMESRLGLSFCDWPNLTFSLASTAAPNHQTSFVAPGSDGFRPYLDAPSTGLEVMHRWRSHEVVHVLAGANVGGITAQYRYVHYVPNGAAEHFVVGKSSTWFLAPEIGGEVNCSSTCVGISLSGTASPVRSPRR